MRYHIMLVCPPQVLSIYIPGKSLMVHLTGKLPYVYLQQINTASLLGIFVLAPLLVGRSVAEYGCWNGDVPARVGAREADV
jgi:hypothetical protein